MRTNRNLFALVGVLALASPAVAQAAQNPGHRVFLPQAKESKDLSEVRLPTYQGKDTSGNAVTFIVTDASNRAWAKRFGANFSPKLANAIKPDPAFTGKSATMQVTWTEKGGPVFPFTPNFAQDQVVIPGSPGRTDCPAGTTPSRVIDDIPVDCSAPAADGALGEGLTTANGTNSYSPLIELQTPDGPVVLNAPHIANSTGKQDRALKLHGDGQVTFVLTAGEYKGHTIHYITTESSIPIIAALEATTFAPAMNRTPSTQTNDNIATTTRSGIAPITNGPTGLGNPERQGLTSAIFDGAASPLNIIQFTPDDTDGHGQTLYSPIWDIHLATWNDGFTKTRITAFADLFNTPALDAADGAPEPHPVFFWTANCPIVSTDGDGVQISPEPT